MPALSSHVVVEFCKLCDWSYQVWLNHLAMFDDNPRSSELRTSVAADAFLRLRTISHEYTLLQIAKLHDRAVVAGEVTLGIEYVLKYGGWDQPTLDRLNNIATKLEVLAKNLRSVRNKLLSHNDLAAVLSGAPLGEFKKGEDTLYFAALQGFADVIHASVVGGPFPFDDLAKNDAIAFLSIVKP